MGEKNFKSGRKIVPIIVLILTIILCIIEIAGLTLALFTNQDDGKIGITTTSGKCRVDIVNENDVSLIGGVLKFVTEDGRSQILFEPGAMFYTEGFAVKNEGNIPVNIRVYVSEDPSYDMSSFDEAFEFWITKDPTDPDAAQRIKSFDGRLEVNEKSDLHYIIIKMKETAGNEFQGKNFSGLGITVYAVQGNVVIGG